MGRKLVVLLGSIAVVMVIVICTINRILNEDDLSACVSPSILDNCTTADAIVAVSGGDTEARAVMAIRLFKAGWARQIIFSGASADPDSISNAEAMRRLAIEAGIPKRLITVEEKSRDTKENAENTVKILHELRAKNVILVSSPYHLKRVKLNFEYVDDTIYYRTMPANDKLWHRWFLTKRGWAIAITELLGIAKVNAESE